MAGNGGGGGGGGGNSTRGGGASISAAAAADVGSADARFPHQSQERRSRWGGCFGGLSCFGSQKGGKRIVPASRDGSATNNRANGVQSAGPSNQNTSHNLSLIAPPSSPASFTNSALPSTAQSPSFMSMSASPPGGPSSTMFVTGPYAHETQLVSPPVFSTFTTEPSTAPLTPPPELAHLTTPSSPDVPFAQFLSSSLNLKGTRKENNIAFLSSGYVSGSDLQATYPLYPGSPSSSLISPASGTPRTGLSSPFPEQEIPTQWGAPMSNREPPFSRNGSSKLFGLGSGTSRNFMVPSDSSFFCPATSAQFYLDQAQQSIPSYSHSGARLSFSREAEVYGSGGNRHNKTCKQDAEEIEAYRASFGFSADEIITTPHYVEISDPVDDNFTMSPFGINKPCTENYPESDLTIGGQNTRTTLSKMSNSGNQKATSDQLASGDLTGAMDLSNGLAASKQNYKSEAVPLADGGQPFLKSGEEAILKSMHRQLSKRIQVGHSCSDAEVDYRRARSLKDVNGILAWRSSPS